MTIVLTTTHPVAQCVDLRATFAGQFRFAWDPSYHAERSEFRRIEAPWLTVIPCRHGHIFPWGGRRLAAYCRGRVRIRRLVEMPIVVTAQRGEDEVIVTFDVDDIEVVATFMGARRKRQLPPEERAWRAARMAYINEARKQRGKGASSDPETTIAVEPVAESPEIPIVVFRAPLARVSGDED